MTAPLPIDDARRLVLAHARPLSAEEVTLAEALGRVAAADATAAVDLPPFSSSAMDGFAVRAADTPGTLKVAGESAAGRPAPVAVSAGTAVAISTGAVVPEGADAVVPVEETTEADGGVSVGGVSPGANVRPRGGDVAAGAVVVARGMRLAPAAVAALAAAGVPAVSCACRPRVAVLSTGSELRPPGAPLAAGQIYESNGLLLSAQLRTAGALASVREPVPDDEEVLRRALAEALEADVLLTSGGVSVGPHDLVRRLLAEAGVEEVFWGVAVRPGKPLFFGTRGTTLVFGLPGNPVSALVGFELFVRPALEALQGLATPGPSFRPGRLLSPLRRDARRDQLVRALSRAAEDAVALEPLTGQESHMIVRAAAADALVLVPRGEGELAAGDTVSYLSV
ncbi:MAG TPA: gephyrin-like molybdotransferase Glp [Gaiellaceae bacterium]|nr:gephyrin-like molybdotransferase Glp [Gaiellaceae bacterium]